MKGEICVKINVDTKVIDLYIPKEDKEKITLEELDRINNKIFELADLLEEVIEK